MGTKIIGLDSYLNAFIGWAKHDKTTRFFITGASVEVPHDPNNDTCASALCAAWMDCQYFKGLDLYGFTAEKYGANSTIADALTHQLEYARLQVMILEMDQFIAAAPQQLKIELDAYRVAYFA